MRLGSSVLDKRCARNSWDNWNGGKHQQKQQQVPMIHAQNFSLGVNLMFKFSAMMAKALGVCVWVGGWAGG
jgi:hypothetical protein